jgi:hypothetical protein
MVPRKKLGEVGKKPQFLQQKLWRNSTGKGQNSYAKMVMDGKIMVHMVCTLNFGTAQ